MYTPCNGWTKATILRAIREGMQDRPSWDAEMKRCVYRAPDGARCAVGVFIPDDLYAASCERMGAGVLLATFPGLVDSMPLSEGALLRLQHIHDTTALYVDPRPELIKWIKNNVAEDSACTS